MLNDEELAQTIAKKHIRGTSYHVRELAKDIVAILAAVRFETLRELTSRNFNDKTQHERGQD